MRVVESGRDCETCDGTGFVDVRRCNHSGNCPCGMQEIPCDDDSCIGGKQACEYCGEEIAVVDTTAGEFCQRCAAAWESERRTMGLAEPAA